ncbi:MAG: glycogen debranching enzyme family protein [Chloroflexi bacterium]|nr:glycogen debranching enzyme family protein [Chloroflexota bacterium]
MTDDRPNTEFVTQDTADFDAPVQREWLVTNGIGGYAMGAINGTRTRRYHGLLVAALQPPVGRWLMAAGTYESVVSPWGDHYVVASRRDAERAYPPDLPVAFALEGSIPTWRWDLPDGTLAKKIWMEHGANTTYVRYSWSGDEPVRVSAEVGAVYRDHHEKCVRAGPTGALPGLERRDNGVAVRLGLDAHTLLIAGRGVSITPVESLWRRGTYLAVEDERGFDHIEDVRIVARFDREVSAESPLTVVLSAEHAPDLDGEAGLSRRIERDRALISAADAEGAPVEVRHLVLAADQFVVQRALADGTPGSSVIAGYPWFGDWGRDTMIALPGLTLATGRADIAKQILLTYARYVDQGMLPNRFPDSGESPEYNTADATLWYFEAIRAYHATTGDDDSIRALYPVLADIVRWHVAGTRYGIGVDSRDGLLRCGSPGANLTWMDAKVEGSVMTPRHGKPVEINALWINALAVMHMLAPVVGGSHDTYEAQVRQASASFGRYWDAAHNRLYDGIDPIDDTLRPNQAVAAMLPTVPLSDEQRRAVVDSIASHLAVAFGVRTLPQGHPEYHGVFTGDWRTRDAMYHRGPAWSWLLGPYLSAHLLAYGDREAAQKLLGSALKQVYVGCVGSVSELYDGDPPHHARAASAQAWGVAELLRVWASLR